VVKEEVKEVRQDGKEKKRRNRNHPGSGKRKTVSIKKTAAGREQSPPQAQLPIAALNKRLGEINQLKQKKIEVDRIRARARERRGADDE